jgi:DNA-binding NtrC family response regulator
VRIGLGFAGVRRILEQAGGAIVADAVGRGGTTVSLYVPAASSDDAPGFSTHDESAADALVLVVDDDELALAASERILRDAGYRVITARSAGHALLELNRRTIDVLVTEALLPVLSGSDLALEARRIRPGLSVVFTDADGPGVGGLDHRTERTSFIRKPLSATALVRAVRSVRSAMQLVRDADE